MKKLMGFFGGLLILILASGCGKTGVDPIEDATDIDAIINIIRYDNAALFTANLLDMPIPDTSRLLDGQPYQLVTYWRTVNWDSLFIKIDSQDTVIEDSTRIVPFRTVAVEQFFKGTLEIIALDTTNGDSRRVHLSKSYSAKGIIPGLVKKYGFNYNSRRGWLLAELGNTIYGTQTGQVRIWPAEHPDNIITVGLRTYPLTAYPVFAPGESLVVSVTITDSIGAVAIKCPTAAGFQWQKLSRTQSGTYEGGFKFYDNIYDKHIIVDLIRSQVLTQDTARYNLSAIGVLYNVR